MWSAKSKLNAIKSRMLRCAVRLDYIPINQAKTTDAAIEKLNGSTPTLDWLIEQGHLSKTQGDRVAQLHAHDFPADRLLEETKKLRRAVRRSDAGLTRLENVLRKLDK